jgi:hypothetical protein
MIQNYSLPHSKLPPIRLSSAIGLVPRKIRIEMNIANFIEERERIAPSSNAQNFLIRQTGYLLS